MGEPSFVHLHVHTHYSMLDGACKVPALVKRCKELGMDAIAISDHGAMFGAIEFYSECRKEGIKPIIGLEAYMAPGDRRERSTPGGNAGEAAYHLLLLAQDIDGYHNLLKLASTAYRDGFYYKPRIDKAVLAEFNKGIIATSACLGGEIPSAFMKRDAKAARAIAETYLKIFGPDRFFIEVQKQGIHEQDLVNPELVELAKKIGCGTVATNDVHFLHEEDHFAHDVLCCISMGRLVSDENRLKYPTELYLKSPAQMHAALGDFPEALANTRRIADACNLELDFSRRFAPVYRVPEGALRTTDAPAGAGAAPMKEDERYLRQLCEQGLEWRYGAGDVGQEVRRRLDNELKVIAAKNFCSYFLIVWDFCNYARDRGIPVGARGSAVGTMVGYLLGLCNVDPLRYGLLFERFMDPSRNEMPDIDIDICQEGRQKVIEYVRGKYGHVAQIITFGTLAAKAACKDVGRVLGVPLAEIDRLTKLIPGTPGMTLKKALAQSPELAELYKSNPRIKQVIDLAQKLEGLCRNAGCHAAGVIIADQPIENIAPLYKTGEDILTQFEGPIAEKVGLLKMDFLGLRTLTTLERALDLEHRTRAARGVSGLPEGVPTDARGRIDIERIDFADPTVLGLFRRGESRGIFQFESGGMQDLLLKMQPDRIEDLIAANALYRPGPMELIPSYCDRKHRREAVPAVHPIVDQILAETYGIMTYQEQVMQIFNQLGGIELANAYKLIKAISKKTTDVIARFKPEFIRGATDKGVSKAGAESIFDLILKFGGYGFNKCVVGSTVVTDARTGERTTVAALFGARRPMTIHALGNDGKLHARAVTDVMSNGRRRVFELRTAQGKRITATANHPFRTLDGWTLLEALKVGDRIAAPRRLSVPTTRSWPKHQLVTLAGLIAEGNTCHPACLYFFGNGKALVDDFADAAGQFEQSVARVYERQAGKYEVCVSTGDDRRFPKGHKPWNWSGRATATARVALVQTPPRRCGAFRWADSLGIVGKKAAEKFVPSEVFTLCDADVALFVGRLWAGDGFIANQTQSVPYYATSSRQLAVDVQALLLRLGIVSGIHDKQFKYRGTLRPGYTVHLVGREAMEGFLQRVAPHCLGRQAQTDFLRRRLEKTDRALTSKDTIPADVRAWVDQERRRAGLTWRELEARSQLSMKEFVGRGSAHKRGFRRDTIARLAAFFASRRLAHLSDSDIFWDRIVSIEPMGVADTYDLSVADDHNFIADGLIVHNSHSTRYAIVAFQTAYMKAYHPVEYMAALLTFEMGSTDKVVEYIEECRRIALPDGSKGIGVLPPDVNVSDVDFTPVYEAPPAPRGKRKRAAEPRPTGVIRFGLGAVKGVGTKAVEAIIAARQAGAFRSIYDFAERVDLRAVNRATVEALIKCGAFAGTGANRAQLLAVLDKAIELGQQAQADRRMGQMNMFGGAAAVVARPATDALPEVREFKNAELLKYEKDVLGFYITSHPLSEHQHNLERYGTDSTGEALHRGEGAEVIIGGMIARVKKNVAKSGRSAGKQWAVVTLEDLEGPIDGMVFAECYEAVQAKGEIIAPERIVFMKGKIDKRRETPCVIVNDIIPIEDAVAQLSTGLLLKLERARHDAQNVPPLKQVLARHKGNAPVFVELRLDEQRNVMLRLDPTTFVRPQDQLLDDLAQALGVGAAEFIGVGTKRKRRMEQRRLFHEPAEVPEPLDAPAEIDEALEA